MTPTEGPSPLRRLAILRIIGLILTVPCVLIGLFASFGAYQYYSMLDRCAQERMMEGSIDCSRKFEWSFPYRQSSSAPLEIEFHLDVHDPARAASLMDHPRSSIGSTILLDERGVEVAKSPFWMRGPRLDSPSIMLVSDFHGVRIGSYTVRINIERPVSDMAGLQQTIIAKYHICPCAYLPIYAATAVTLICAFFVALSSVLVLPNLIRHGIWRAARPPVDGPISTNPESAVHLEAMDDRR